MEPSKSSPQIPKKRMASGAAEADFANKRRYHNRVGGPDEDLDSCPRDLAAENKIQEDLNVGDPPRMAEKLLLDIHYECARNNIDLPWDRIAQRLKLGPSSGAVHQFLWRTRQQLIAEGHVVPPQVGLGERRNANNDPDVRGFVRNPENRADFPTTRAVDQTDSYNRWLNLPDAVNAPSVETPSRKKAIRTDFFDEDSSPEVEGCTTVALRSRRGTVEKTFEANIESCGDKDAVEIDEDDPFSDVHEYREEAAGDDGACTVDKMESTICDRLQLGDIVSQVDNHTIDNVAATTDHIRARQLSGAQQVSSLPYGSSFEECEPPVASIHGPILVSYDGGLSFNHVPSSRTTRWPSFNSVYTGTAAAQIAADLGYGETVQSLFNQTFDNPLASGSVTPFQAFRSGLSPTGVDQGSPTPTAKNPRHGATQKLSAALPTTPTPRRKQRSGTCRSVMPSHVDPEDEASPTPRATARSLSLGAPSATTTSSIEPRRASGLHTVAPSAMRDIHNRSKDDDDLSNSFADMGFRGPG